MSWGKVDDRIAGLVGLTLAGWAGALAARCNGRTGVGTVSVRELAAAVDRSSSTATAAIRALKRAGLVKERGKAGPGQPRTLVCVWIADPKSCPQAREQIARGRAIWSRAPREQIARFEPATPISLSDGPDGEADDAAYVAAGLAGLAAARAALEASPRARWRARTDPRRATITRTPRTAPPPLPHTGEAAVGAQNALQRPSRSPLRISCG